MDKKKFAGNPTGVAMMAVINVLFNQSLVVSQSCLVPFFSEVSVLQLILIVPQTALRKPMAVELTQALK
jgi:hypothetical protein